ncbi:MAG: hypothetical protein QXG39_02710 [Candidatus Aenigmatarchaeota archaeon]
MKRRNIAVILFILLTYGTLVATFKGKLKNQTAIVVDAGDAKIFSLMVNETIVSEVIPMELSRWKTEPENVSPQPIPNGVVFSGIPINYSIYFIFNATLEGLHLNFSKFPYFHALISSSPDISIDLLIGTLRDNLTLGDQLLVCDDDIVIDEKYIWKNCSSHIHECFDNHTSHSITVNVKEILSKMLSDRIFSAIQIKTKLRGFLKPELKDSLSIRLTSLSLIKDMPYYLSPKVSNYHLPDGTAVFVIKGSDDFSRFIRDYPYLQRVYIKYSINAPQNSLYIILVASKEKGRLIASRSDFIFCHSSRLNEVATHIDWRQLILFNKNYDPISGLNYLMKDGDYAVIFTPVNRSEIRGVTLNKVEFTFSKIQSAGLALPNLDEGTITMATLFILTIAGILPSLLLLALLYMHIKNKLNNNKRTITAILIIGLTLRLITAPITAFTNDLQVFAQLGALYYGSGVLGAQWVSLPGFVYIQTATYLPYALLRAAGFQDFQFLALSVYILESLFVKIPSLLSDLGIALYLRKMSQRFVPAREALLWGTYLLNPLTLYVSAILGQFDTIFVFTIILSTYYLIIEYDKIKASVFSSLCTIINPVGAATFMPLIAKIRKEDGFISALKMLLLSISIFGILMVPFMFEPRSPVFVASYERFLAGIPGEAFYGKQFTFYLYGSILSYSVGYGLTFRFMLEFLSCEPPSFLYPHGTLVAFLTLTAVFLYRMNKVRELTFRENLLLGTFLLNTVIIFQLTFPTIFDQFVIWVTALLLIAYILSNEQHFLAIFAAISVATGFIYVAVWRNYLRLISGVEKVTIGNPYLSNIAGAFIGTLYSALLIVILMITLRLWFQTKN